MIFSHRLEPNHQLEEYICFDGDDADFIQTRHCTEHPDDPEAICERCGFCEDVFYACSEDEYEDMMEE